VTSSRSPSIASCAGVGILWAAIGCNGTLDAGRDVPRGMLPVDARNPVIIDNDTWEDDWSGEHAALLASTGGLRIAGIIASASPYWPDATFNATGWGKMVAAARASGLKNIPDVTMSTGLPLVRPASGQVDETTKNDSAGANLIVNLSRELSTPSRPLVVICLVPLTNLADAYLIDHSVVDRVVVVAQLGELGNPNTTMDGPNGDLDPWADWIVAQKYPRYVQVSAYYPQAGDVTEADLGRLPDNPLGDWMRDKQPKVFTIPQASDQISVLAVALPTFVLQVQPVTPDLSVAFDNMQGPPLRPDDTGKALVVTKIDSTLAATTLWEKLLDPKTFGS
jgi:hypothetical protein